MNKKLIIMILGGVVLAGGGTAVGLMLGKKSVPTETIVVAPPPEEVGLLEMDTFLANLGGERFAKVTLQLAVVPKGQVSDIQGDVLLTARMRDRVLSLLTSKSAEELGGPMGRESFRNEIRMRLSPLVEEGEVKEVLFSEFIIQ